jgi:predicted DNA-binding transcriptional regulator AlpA
MRQFHSVNAAERSTGVGAAYNAVFATRKISVRETAAYLGISKSFLDKSRLDGTGPVYLKIGRRVAYDLGDLEIWIASRKRRHTSEVTLLQGEMQS